MKGNSSQYVSDVDFEIEEVATPRAKITDADILRWSSWTCPFPLPTHLVPTAPQYFEDVSDDVLLTASPHLIAHIQRTAGAGRATDIQPASDAHECADDQVKSKKWELGDRVVGSTANPGMEWPTLDDTDFGD